jgi:succinate dehydrogenase / fumarate reductase membrane anchor subunit
VVAVVRGRVVTGAHYGLRDWLVQRLSAVVMLAYGGFLVGYVMTQGPVQYADWKALFANQWMRFASLLFLLSLFFHAWVGMRDILMDYVHPTGIRLFLHTALILVLALYGIWAVQILWSLG